MALSEFAVSKVGVSLRQTPGFLTTNSPLQLTKLSVYLFAGYPPNFWTLFCSFSLQRPCFQIIFVLLHPNCQLCTIRFGKIRSLSYYTQWWQQWTWWPVVICCSAEVMLLPLTLHRQYACVAGRLSWFQGHDLPLRSPVERHCDGLLSPVRVETLSDLTFSSQDTNYNTYINHLRINHFIRLYNKAVVDLRNFTAQELALESGFRSYRTFSEAFKRQTGLSVTAWMKGLKNS